VSGDRPRADRNAAAIRDNNVLWDEWATLHAGSAFYDLEGFRRGGIRLGAEEVAEIGDVAGRDLLHLQCTRHQRCRARFGARVTGADFE
jgi:hypothetical protein